MSWAWSGTSDADCRERARTLHVGSDRPWMGLVVVSAIVGRRGCKESQARERQARQGSQRGSIEHPHPWSPSRLLLC